MEPGIRGKTPFIGTPTPNLCPGCGDRLFSVKPGLLKCELCGAEVVVLEGTTAHLQEGWGGHDDVPRLARPSNLFQRQRQKRKTGMLMI